MSDPSFLLITKNSKTKTKTKVWAARGPPLTAGERVYTTWNIAITPSTHIRIRIIVLFPLGGATTYPLYLSPPPLFPLSPPPVFFFDVELELGKCESVGLGVLLVRVQLESMYQRRLSHTVNQCTSRLSLTPPTRQAAAKHIWLYGNST